MQQYTSPQQAYSHQPAFITRVMGYVALAFAIAAAGTFFAEKFIPIQFFMGSSQWLIYILVMAMALTSHMWSEFQKPMNFLMFTLFALVMGVMFYPLLMYALAVGGVGIAVKAFGVTAMLTLAAGMYAQNTKRDLSGLGGFFTFAIIGLILVSIINAIWYNGMTEAIISGVGIILFSGLIAYNVQMLRYYPEDQAMNAGIGLFISIFNLLTSVLRLFLAFGND